MSCILKDTREITWLDSHLKQKIIRQEYGGCVGEASNQSRGRDQLGGHHSDLNKLGGGLAQGGEVVRRGETDQRHWGDRVSSTQQPGGVQCQRRKWLNHWGPPQTGQIASSMKWRKHWDPDWQRNFLKVQDPSPGLLTLIPVCGIKQSWYSPIFLNKHDFKTWKANTFLIL